MEKLRWRDAREMHRPSLGRVQPRCVIGAARLKVSMKRQDNLARKGTSENRHEIGTREFLGSGSLSM